MPVFSSIFLPFIRGELIEEIFICLRLNNKWFSQDIVLINFYKIYSILLLKNYILNKGHEKFKGSLIYFGHF